MNSGKCKGIVIPIKNDVFEAIPWILSVCHLATLLKYAPLPAPDILKGC